MSAYRAFAWAFGVTVFVLTSTALGQEFSAASSSKKPSVSQCSCDEILTKLKKALPFSESAVTYSSAKGEHDLTIWFVDEGINPKSVTAAMEGRFAHAVLRITALADDIIKVDPCVAKLFTVVRQVLVDSEYNCWLVASIKTADIPKNDLSSFKLEYVRSEYPQPGKRVADDSCNWHQARAKIESHFPKGVTNWDFYFSVTEEDATVTAQIVLDPFTNEMLIVSLLNLMQELICLRPSPTVLLVNAVDARGNLKFAGGLPMPKDKKLSKDSMGDLLNDLRIIYENR